MSCGVRSLASLEHSFCLSPSTLSPLGCVRLGLRQRPPLDRSPQGTRLRPSERLLYPSLIESPRTPPLQTREATTMEGVSAAANIIAVVQLLERVATLCFKYGKAVRSAKSDIERLQAELGRLKTVLGDAQKLLGSPNGARLSTSQAFCGTLKECLSQLDAVEIPLNEKSMGTGKRKIVMSRMGFRALKWPFESEEVTRIVQALKECRDALSASLCIDQTYVSIEVLLLCSDRRLRWLLTRCVLRQQPPPSRPLRTG